MRLIEIGVALIAREAREFGFGDAKSFRDAQGKAFERELSKEGARKLKRAIPEAGGTVELV